MCKTDTPTLKNIVCLLTPLALPIARKIMKSTKLRTKPKPFVPYYKNYAKQKKKVAALLKNTRLTYHDIGIRLGVSDHTVTDTNKELQIRPRKPKHSKVRPDYDLYIRNRNLEKSDRPWYYYQRRNKSN